MKKYLQKGLLIATLLVFLTLLSACSGEQVDVSVPVNLTNTASGTYTIWIGHDTEINSANDIVAGSFRSTAVTMTAIGPSKDNLKDLKDTIKINVAKDGKLVTSEKLQVNLPYYASMILTITWDGKTLSVQ